MGLCATVEALAEAVAHAKQPSEPRHRLGVEILRLMPLYGAAGDLGAWVDSFHRVMTVEPEEESDIGRLLWGVFALGESNMYAAVDVPQTAAEFRDLAEEFRRCGVAPPEHQGLDDW